MEAAAEMFQQHSQDDGRCRVFVLITDNKASDVPCVNNQPTPDLESQNIKVMTIGKKNQVQPLLWTSVVLFFFLALTNGFVQKTFFF